MPTVGELATRLQIAQHGMVTLVTRCEKAGLVERVPGKDDRRVVCVRLTPAGERAVRRIAAWHVDELWSAAKVLRAPRLTASAKLETAKRMR